MKKKFKKKSKKLLNLHVYGIFNKNTKKVIKISLDHFDIETEMALLGELGERVVECEFDIRLVI